jgi:large subunit ribosomal protein L4
MLIVTEASNDNVFLASRNLYQVSVLPVENVDPVSLVAAEKVIITASALKRLEERLA